MERVNLVFKHLPDYAAFLLNNKLNEFAAVQLQYAKDIKFPLLKFFEHMPEEEMIAMSIIDLTKFFNYLIENKAKEQIEDGMKQWKENLLPLVDKHQVVAEDITLSSYLKKKMFTHYLNDYTQSIELGLRIIGEVDEYNAAMELAFFKLFSSIQHEKIEDGIKQLKESDHLYKQSQALTHIGNWVWDVETGKVKWSDELYRIYGLEPNSEEITFERFISLVHPDDRENRIKQIQNAVATHNAPDYTMRIVTHDGKIKVLQGKNEVIVENGKAVRIAGTCQDITKEYHLHKQLEEEKANVETANKVLEQKNIELERSNKELTAFSYIASHDLQEPLRKIKTFNSLLVQRDGASLSNNAKEILAKVDVSVSRMQTLIRDLLSFSRTHSELHQFEQVDLNNIVADVYAIYNDSITDTKLEMKYDRLPAVSGIPFQLTQLFNNIIGNSIKYAKQGKALVNVSVNTIAGHELNVPDADKEKQYYCISIADNGIGFDESYADKIFEIFQRLHNKHEYSGTGIGLAICKKIVQNHNGFISASSKEGEGATFNVYLPQPN